MTQQFTQETPRKPLVPPAFGGVLLGLAILATLGLSFYSVLVMISLIFKLVVSVVALYELGAFLQFWLARSYQDGLTLRELGMTQAWPYYAFKLSRATNRQEFGAIAASMHVDAAVDRSLQLLNKPLAVLFGVLAPIGIIVFEWYVTQSVFAGLLWLLFAAFAAAVTFQLLAIKAHRRGLTLGELFQVITGPIGLAVKMGSLASRVRRTSPAEANPSTS